MHKAVELFEKTLIIGFSCVNTRLTFDTKILILNLSKKDFEKLSIDGSFKNRKKDDLKVVYRLQLEGENEHHNQRIVSKIFKLMRTTNMDRSGQSLSQRVVLKNKNLFQIEENLI